MLFYVWVRTKYLAAQHADEQEQVSGGVHQAGGDDAVRFVGDVAVEHAVGEGVDQHQRDGDGHQVNGARVEQRIPGRRQQDGAPHPHRGLQTAHGQPALESGNFVGGQNHKVVGGGHKDDHTHQEEDEEPSPALGETRVGAGGLDDVMFGHCLLLWLHAPMTKRTG